MIRMNQIHAGLLFITALILSCLTAFAHPAYMDDCLRSESLNHESVRLRQTDRSLSLKKAMEAYEMAARGKCEEMKALSMKNMGVIHLFTGEWDLAISNFRDGLRTYESISHQAGISACSHNLAYVFEKKAMYDSALVYYTRSIEIDRVSGDMIGVASTKVSIGNLHYLKGEYNKALDLMLEALQINRVHNDPEGEADCLQNIASILVTQKVYDKAAEKYKEAYAILDRLGDEFKKSMVNYNLGAIEMQLGRYEEAIALYTKSLVTKLDFNDKEGVANALSNIGTCYQRMEMREKALEYFLQALKSDQELGNVRGIATHLGAIGSNLYDAGEHTQALNYLNMSLELASGAGIREIMADAHKSLVNVHMALKNYDLAYTHLLKYNELAQSMQIGIDALSRIEYGIPRIARLIPKAASQKLFSRHTLLFTSLAVNILLIILLAWRRFRKTTHP